MISVDGDKTSTVLQEMLQEPVQGSFLDSGGFPIFDNEGNYLYSKQGMGRSWEINQNVDFEQQPERWVEFFANGELEIIPHGSTYHYLKEHTSYWPELDSLFSTFADRVCNVAEGCEDDEWIEENILEDKIPGTHRVPSQGRMVDVFPVWLHQAHGFDTGGLTGKAAGCIRGMTAEQLTVFDQDFQYAEFYLKGELNGQEFCGPACLIQSHQGCDVRDGYGTPRAFYADEMFHKFSDAEISCSRCWARWWTDDCYHWYPSFHQEDLRPLSPVHGRKPYSVREVSPELLSEMREEACIMAHQDAIQKKLWDVGDLSITDAFWILCEQELGVREVVLVDETDISVAYCPKCGMGQLKIQ